MKRHQAALVVAIALVVALGALTPAIGRLSKRSSPAKEARVAKKIAKKALRRANQALRSAGTPGPAGSPGAAGLPGADGTALAYAKVSSTGQVDGTRAKGVPAGPLYVPAPGIYCFDLSFAPQNIVASVTDEVTGNAVVLLPPAVGPICESHDSAEVITTDPNGAFVSRGFYVLFN
jgi:hypothetical protein